jgi:hypothetical protein
MAIIKELNTKFGVGASYHRITAFNISYLNKKITVCVASYLSKEARASNNHPIEELDISIPFSDEGYNWLKQNVIGFEDALDDYDVLGPPLPEPIVEEVNE